jgi:hypothetical protein
MEPREGSTAHMRRPRLPWRRSAASSDLLWKSEMRLRRDKSRDAVGRPSWRSSFLGDPGTKFLCGKQGIGTKNEKKSKKKGRRELCEVVFNPRWNPRLIRSGSLKPLACVEVMHNGCLLHKGIVNPFMIDCGRFGSAISAVVIENELPANGRDGSGVSDRISTDILKFVNIGFTRKL